MEVAAQTSPPSEIGVPALEARGIVREYGRVTAVAGINVSLEPGDFLTVFGPNGAGKSSLLGLLAGALRPTRGDVSSTVFDSTSVQSIGGDRSAYCPTRASYTLNSQLRRICNFMADSMAWRILMKGSQNDWTMCG